jgi:hypothetical protein
MLFALVVMAGVLLLVMVVNNRRATDWSSWAYVGGDDGDAGDSGSDCGSDAGGCDGRGRWWWRRRLARIIHE